MWILCVAALACVLIPICVCFLKGKEMAEEEDEVAVGMEKGFMDEFFEQVGSFNAPGPSIHQRADGIYSSHVKIKPHMCVLFPTTKMTPPISITALLSL